ncbi:MAG: TRAP transporter substrate-binding protein [Synergistaceae bacterium]|jgi:tripartite ATP-independent transporter DctP family solute receptor|nr:TRAP transporter substrate-binding protein [Synergistaceae bacterium]
MKKFLGVIVTFLFLFAAMGVGEAAVELKFGHALDERDIYHEVALKFEELVEARSNGEITVTIYPNTDLGDEHKLLESLNRNAVDMCITTGGPVVNFLPSFGVLDLPFLFSTPAHAYKVLDGPVGADFFKAMEKLGWKGLAYGERGFRNLTNSVRPVEKPEDIKGLKIRVMQNPIYVESFTTLGANAIPMAWSEAVAALRQGTIDGQENPLNAIVAYNIDESNKYLSLTRHAYAPNVILMSMKIWNELTPEQQKVVSESAIEAAKYNRDIDNDMEAEWLQVLKDTGMQVSEPDLSPFRDAVKSIYEKYEPEYGKDLIQSILNTK